MSNAGDALPADAPDGQLHDDSYTTRQSDPVPVQKDDANVEDPINPEQADSEEQLGAFDIGFSYRTAAAQSELAHYTDYFAERDEKDAIDESNILDERTRGAKPAGTYAEPPDEV